MGRTTRNAPCGPPTIWSSARARIARQ